jgi:hypothetical protein
MGRTVLFALLVAVLTAGQPRTADPLRRGFKESDFPRVVVGAVANVTPQPIKWVVID